MINLQEMDPNVGIRDQFTDSTDEPVVLINVFHVDPDDVDALLRAWKDDAEYFKGQSGFISTQLHRGIAGSTTFLNYAVWESVAHFRAAFGNPAFQAKLGAYPDSATSSPHLFRKLAVSGLCVA
jgi:heme-degrading monooxygenase HmoA